MLPPRAQVPPAGASSPGTTETPLGLTGSNTMHQGLEEQAPTVPVASTVPADPSPCRLPWAGEPEAWLLPAPQAAGRAGGQGALTAGGVGGSTELLQNERLL